MSDAIENARMQWEARRTLAAGGGGRGGSLEARIRAACARLHTSFEQAARAVPDDNAPGKKNLADQVPPEGVTPQPSGA